MRKKLLLSIGFSLGATALTAVTVGWMGRPQEQALLSPVTESERAQVVDSLRADRHGKGRQRVVQQLLELMEEQDPERLAWQEVHALRRDLEASRDQLRQAETQHSCALRQLRGEYHALRTERDQHQDRVAHLERMSSLLSEQLRLKVHELDRLQLAASVKESALTGTLEAERAELRRSSERLAELRTRVSTTEEQLAQQEKLTRQSEEELRGLRSQHAALAALEVEHAEARTKMQHEQRLMQRQSWVAQEALSCLREEAGALEAELAALHQQEQLHRAELGEFQGALAQAIADRGVLQRQLIVAQEAVRLAEQLASLPVSHNESDWLMHLTETQMVLESVLAHAEAASALSPVSSVLHQTLTGLKSNRAQLERALEATRQANEALATSRQRVEALERDLATSATLRHELQHLVQQHAQIATSLGARGQHADEVAVQTASHTPAAPAPTLQSWLDRTQQTLEQPSPTSSSCSRAACLKAEMEALAAKAGDDWQPLAACCARWASEVSALSDELVSLLPGQQSQLAGAVAREQKLEGEALMAREALMREQRALKRTTARARGQIASVASVAASTGAEPDAEIATAAALGEADAVEASERILQLEALVAAKSHAASELAERVAVLEKGLEERRANLASVTEQLVEIESLREQEASELVHARTAQKQGASEAAQQLVVQQRQLAEALAELNTRRNSEESLRREFETLTVLHRQEEESLRALTAKQQETESAVAQALELANQDLQRQIAAFEERHASNLTQLQKREEQELLLRQQLSELEANHTTRVAELQAALDAKMLALEALQADQQSHLHHALSLRLDELQGLQGQLEQEQSRLAIAQEQLKQQDEALADLQKRHDEMQQQREMISLQLQEQREQTLQQELARDEVRMAAQAAEQRVAVGQTQLEAAQQENALLCAQLEHLQNLRMDVRLAEVRQELFELKSHHHQQQAQLDAAAREGLELQEALAQLTEKQAQLLAQKASLEQDAEHWKLAATQARQAAFEAEQTRAELAQRLEQMEGQQLPGRLQEALAQIEELELDLAKVTQSAHQQAQRLEQMEQLVAGKETGHQEELAHQRQLAAQLEEQIAALQQTVQQRGREILMAESAQAARLMELESGIAAREAEVNAAKRDLDRVQQELAQLQGANWEARARQLEGQSEVLLSRAGEAEREKAFLQRTCDDLREQLAAVQLSYSQQEVLLADQQAHTVVELASERSRAEARLQVLQEALAAQQERIAMAESSAQQREMALNSLEREKAALEQALAQRYEQEWSERLADAQHELQMTRAQLSQAQEERQSRMAFIEQMETRFQAALVQEAQRHKELEVSFQQRVGELEQKVDQERASAQQRVADLQKALHHAEALQQEQQGDLLGLQHKLDGAQQRLDQASAAQQEQERLRTEESHSAKERALGLETRYQSIVATLRTEQDQRLAKVSELENQVALRDSQMEHQLKSLERAHQLLDETRHQSLQLATRLRDVETQLASSQQLASSASATAQTLRSSLDQREQQLAQITQDVQDKARLAERSEQIRLELEEQLRISRGKEQDLVAVQSRLSDQSQTEVQRLQELLNTMRRQISDREAERQELRSELLAAQEQLSHLSKARRELQASMADQGGRTEMLQQQIDRLQSMLREGQMQREDQADQISMLQRELDHRQSLLDEEDSKHRALELALLQEKNQVALLEARLNALSGASAQELSTVPQQGRFHLVRQGETLRDIAKRYYGDQREMFRLRTVNQRVLGEQDEPSAGQLLVIP